MVQVVFLYSTAYEEAGLLSMAVLVVTRALQPPVLASYWAFLFLAQVNFTYTGILQKTALSAVLSIRIQIRIRVSCLLGTDP